MLFLVGGHTMESSDEDEEVVFSKFQVLHPERTAQHIQLPLLAPSARTKCLARKQDKRDALLLRGTAYDDGPARAFSRNPIH